MLQLRDSYVAVMLLCCGSCIIVMLQLWDSVVIA